jgi:hypothetical protein
MRRPFLIVFMAFVLSVGVRVPHIDRPLSAHHEFCTAVALIVLHNWWTDGIVAHHGAPVLSFTTPADRYPADDGPAMRDGVRYYFSHPPLAYDLPYAGFRLAGTAPNVAGLQWINIAFHLLAAWCLFLAVRAAFPVGDAPLLAALLYLFMPAPLWFHGNAYMSDMFVQNFWLMHLAVAVPVFLAPLPPDRGRTALFALTLFLAAYTSWPGVFVAVVAMGYALWRAWRSGDGRWAWPAVWSGLAVVVALGITWWRYAGVVGTDALIAYFSSRLEVRGSMDMAEGLGTHLQRLLVNYRISYLPVILLVLGTWASRWAKRADAAVDRGAVRPFLLLTGLPVLLDHTFLLQYADHDFAALKAGPLLCGLAGAGLAALGPRVAWPVVAITCAVGVAYYFRTNPLPGPANEQERVLGTAIAAEARPEEAVFTMGFTPEPQVWWYARRTLFRVDSLPQAMDLLRAQGNNEGLVVTAGPQGPAMRHITLDR